MKRIRLSPRPKDDVGRIADLRTEAIINAMVTHLMR